MRIGYNRYFTSDASSLTNQTLLGSNTTILPISYSCLKIVPASAQQQLYWQRVTLVGLGPTTEQSDPWQLCPKDRVHPICSLLFASNVSKAIIMNHPYFDGIYNGL